VTEIEHVPTPERGAGLVDKMEYARTLAVSSLLPKSYQKQPANVLLAIELGDALGIPTIQAINGIHVIEGKPTASAELIASLVRRAGHKLRVTVDDTKQVAVAQIIRADDPDFVYEARWDMRKAQQAGLAGKGNWKSHPVQMLRNRAVTEVARMGASDALYGVSHTPDEVTFTVPAARDLHQRRVTAAEILGQADDVIDVETGEIPIDAELVDETSPQEPAPDAWGDVEVAQPGGAR